jgi:hypothetical protein
MDQMTPFQFNLKHFRKAKIIMSYFDPFGNTNCDTEYECPSDDSFDAFGKPTATPVVDGNKPIFEPFTPTNIADIDFDRLPNRRWVYGRSLLRGYVSASCGDGGVGKTSFSMGRAISIALGRSVYLLDDDVNEPAHKVHVRGPVLIWTLEDAEQELHLRLAAELKLRGIDPKSLRDMIYLASGRDHPFCAASLDKGGRIIRHNIQPAIDQAKQLGLVACFFDPFVNAHELDGNRNDYIALVLDQFRAIAKEADIAAHINHHFRKGGQAGDAASALGAVSFINACRHVETLSYMSEEDAKTFGIPAEKRRFYVHVTNAKQNLAAHSGLGEYYQHRSVDLCNGSPEYPDGDQIGVLVRWQPQNALAGFAWKEIEALLDKIDAGCDGEYYSSSRKSSRWVCDPIMADLGLSEDAAIRLVKDWLGCAKGVPVLTKGKYLSKERAYQEAQRLCVNPSGKAALRGLMCGGT